MFEIFEKKIKKNVISIFLVSIFILVVICIGMFAKDPYARSEDPVTKWIIIGTISFTFLLWLVCSFYACFWKKRILKYMSKNNIARLDLELEFAKAKEVIPYYWISPQYTFYLGVLSATILKNEEIVKCYQITYAGKYQTYYVGLEAEQKKRYKSAALEMVDVEKVLQYYESNFPHIIIGKTVIKQI